MPYVDDNIFVDDVDRVTGFVSARGISSYEVGLQYKVSGRVSKSGFGVFYYSSAGTRLTGLNGVFILRRGPLGNVEGWWMGNDRENKGEVRGRFTFEKASQNDSFKPKVYSMTDSARPTPEA